MTHRPGSQCSRSHSSALGFLVTSVAFPRSPAQFYVLFYPKVSTVLILIVLNSRTSLRDQSSRGAFANGRKGNTSSGGAGGSGSGSRIPGTASQVRGEHTISAYGRRSRFGRPASGVPPAVIDNGVGEPYELDVMPSPIPPTSPYLANMETGVAGEGRKGKGKELDRVSEEDQKSTAPSEPADDKSLYCDGSKVRLVPSRPA